MLHFYPGPSKLYAGIDVHIQEALASGILSMNHRSQAFMDLYAHVQDGFEQHLHIPKGYAVYFTSSATECWTIINHSFSNKNFLHIFNGAFGKKWMDVSSENKINYHAQPFDLHTDVSTISFDTTTKVDIVCTTLVETSNGSYISDRAQQHIRNHFPVALIAVDATSGMGGMDIKWELADIWFASVQKCFGLPSGLGILILSPRAQKEAQQNSIDTQYNSLKRIVENGSSFQTTHTPNTLDIYLLSKRLPSITAKTCNDVAKQMKALHTHFSNNTTLAPLIENDALQSPTVLALKGTDDYIHSLKNTLKSKNIVIGNGYGEWNKNTIRIANFPAHTSAEFEKLLVEI